VGHGKEKRGSSGAKAALLMPLHGPPKKSVAPHKQSSTKNPQAPGREIPTRSIHYGALGGRHGEKITRGSHKLRRLW